MRRAEKIMSIVAAAGIMLATAPSTLQAEVSQVSDPGEFGILVDPNASGTKVAGFVTLSYEYEVDTLRANECISQRWVRNLYLVATLEKGNEIRPFNSNYVRAGLQDALEGCFEAQDKQMFFLKHVIEKLIVPGLFGCTGTACPAYAVKSIKNFVATGVGAISMEIDLAVK
jgi:hypothetical protein